MADLKQTGTMHTNIQVFGIVLEGENTHLRAELHKTDRGHPTRVAIYHPSLNSLTFPSVFSDFLQFSIPSDR